MISVAATRIANSHYPEDSPYHPSERYPEYPFGERISSKPNGVYRGVRRLLELLELDSEHRGLPDWNPLGHLIRPGMTVAIKPNWVLSRHKDGKDPYAIVTHPSVLRAISDYCWIALKGEGLIIVADAPQYDCNFDELMRLSRLPDVAEFINSRGGPGFEIRDLRRYWSRWKHFPSLLEPLKGDPCGSVAVDLGSRSALAGISRPDKLYGAVYNRRETIASHSGGVHLYELSGTVMNADVIISVPKMKVHKKVGVTLNAKGLVGVNTNKNYLVHYSITPPSRGGDQYPDGLLSPMEQGIIATERWMYDHLLAPKNRVLEYIHRSVYAVHNRSTRRLGIKVQEWKRQFDAGNWFGNDSAWRMTLDLLRAVSFADRRGVLHDSIQRSFFSVVDGIVGGDLLGPLTPDPVRAGALVAGENLLAVDIVAARLMGMDPMRIRTIVEALSDSEFDHGVHALTDIVVASDEPDWQACLTDTTSRLLEFRPHPGWSGRIEAGLDTTRSAPLWTAPEEIESRTGGKAAGSWVGE